MKQLFNYCSLPMYEADVLDARQTLKSFIGDFELDGIEQRVYQPLGQVPYKDLTVGVHLNYWPEWVSFYRNDQVLLNRSFSDTQQLKEYYGGAANVETWLEVIKSNLLEAISVQPEYLVWHVSNAGNAEVFTFNFNYSDADVLQVTAELFNNVCDVIPDDVTVLFENLWWPGLRLIDFNLVERFFASLNKTNVGIMLDTGHLMNTNRQLTSEAEGIGYVCRTVQALGSLKRLIKGVHLSCSLSGSYQQSFEKIVPLQVDYEALLTHIGKIDRHQPFTVPEAEAILEAVQPQYLVHELFYDNLTDLGGKLRQQQKACGLRSR